MDAIDLLRLLKHKLFEDYNTWGSLTKKAFNQAIEEIEGLYKQIERDNNET